MPPPSCTGISSPTSARMALIAGSLTGLPAKAPFRSTRCRRRAPASSQRRAIAAGSSPKVVEAFMSPCCRRTQWPSFRSMAGISSMASGRRVGRRAEERRSGLPGRKLRYRARPWSALFSGWNWVAKMLSRATRAGKARAVVGFARAVARVRRRGVEAVHEVEVAAVRHARPQRVRPSCACEHPVPAHLRHLVAAAVGLQRPSSRKRSTSPGIRPRPGVSCSSLWSSSICMPTHTPISGLLRGGVEHRVLQAGVAQLAHAVAHRALARQHHALGGPHLVGPRGDDHLDAAAARPRAAPPATPSAGCPCRSRRRRRVRVMPRP